LHYLLSDILGLISLVSIFKCYEKIQNGKEAVRFMPRVKKQSTSEPAKKMRPALTPEARENQMIALAEKLAEEQLRNGTASSQIITHYLKLATVREQLEKENLKEDIKLKKAKTDAIESAQKMEELYAEAIKAMSMYGGANANDEEIVND
jgi:hypothetical protein